MKKHYTSKQIFAFVEKGDSTHTDKERAEHDFYATDPKAIVPLLEQEAIPNKVWECCCGAGHLVFMLEEYGHEVVATDLVDRGCGEGGVDFLATTEMPTDCECIITNPPYSLATECVLHALDLLPEGGTLAMFLKINFLAGKRRRKELFDHHPPSAVLVFSERVSCAPNGDWEQAPRSSAINYAWFVWRKGSEKTTIIKWI